MDSVQSGVLGPLRPDTPTTRRAALQALGGHDLICFSHLRWDSVFQRPQHLLTRCAALQRVFYFEEPIIDSSEPWLELELVREGLWVVVPHLPPGLEGSEAARQQAHLLDGMLSQLRITRYVTWYYTPMALAFSRHLKPAAVVYDCMDELTGFRGAPAALREREAELLRLADVVFTGGRSLYEAKCSQHANMHPFPSSIDAAHFASARRLLKDPHDQAKLACPRLGFFGVIDERLDTHLLAGVADARPEWQLIMVGPVVKIDPAELPRRENIHYLGRKPYDELPAYLANWQVAMMPFARNDSTRFISPTKTPEYLAAAKPVISTSIRDVVRPYGERGLVAVADTVEAFVEAAEKAVRGTTAAWLHEVDAFLAGTSWDSTWERMMALIGKCLPPADTKPPRTALTALSE